MSEGYAGDLTPLESWELLSTQSDAQLVDVRTNVEWVFVGVPEIASIGKQVLFQEWQKFPTMEVDSQFASSLSAKLASVSVGKEAPLLFLCRSGGRSQSSAIAMTQSGFSKAYNVTSGFEGQLDPNGHRGNVDGWKVSGLPWVQR